ncbi:MAG: hypothetical protein ABI574_12895 [Burkholderiales bacterium]
MPNNVQRTDFETWYAQLRECAEERDLAWTVCSDPAAHRPGFDAGLSPDEELMALADMAEWRGCGCGGG